MKRILILLFSAFVTTALCAQVSLNKDCYEYDAKPSFLLSIYKNCQQPIVMKMQTSANLIIDNKNDPAVRKVREIASSANLVIDDIFTKVDGKTDDATFEIKVDPDSVYDYSYKIYSAQFSDFKIQYMTYFWADQLSIVLHKKEYSISCIDGGMDVHIKHLSHEYIGTERGEKLSISITEDLPLTAADKSTVLLKKGSHFCFDVEDSKSK